MRIGSHLERVVYNATFFEIFTHDPESKLLSINILPAAIFPYVNFVETVFNPLSSSSTLCSEQIMKD